MGSIARIATPIALDKLFDYHIPPELVAGVRPGVQVRVPWGRTFTNGFVVELATHSTLPVLKPILEVLDPEPMIQPSLLALARWMASYYFAPLEQVLRATLPAAVRRPGAGAKQRLTVRPLRVRDDPDAAALPPKQRATMDALWSAETLALQALLRRAGVTAAPVRTLERKGWLAVAEEAVGRNPLGELTLLPTTPLPLSPQQQAALEGIVAAMPPAPVPGAEPSPPASPPAPILLHGVTGSGKTEVYLQAIAHARVAGRGAIVLVPEIALTPQTIDRFVSRFGPTVAVLHSHLSEGERYDEWHRIRSGAATIVVGARSAVFAPVRPLGIIVVDEEHEPSYKQEEAPRYQARDVAVMRGHLEACVVVLGSATPALESWQNARDGKYRLLRMPLRVDDRRMPAVRIVDMRVNAERTGHVNVFSVDLIEAMGDRLSRGEQTILFLNRRGYATALTCPQCGFTAACSACSVSLVYHRADERIRCHLCAASAPAPTVCPQCSDPAIRFGGFGTQRVETIVRKCLPKARVARMDADATTGKGAHERILGEFRAGKVDILIGTQMIAKGLDFPRVTLVGVVNADLSLHLPDFRAGERTYQLLAQVAGRAGRGVLPGEVIIQTYTPHHPALQAVRRGDFEGFCDQETEARRELAYPPFTRLILLTLRGLAEARVLAAAEALSAALTAQAPAGVRVSEACPAPLARVKSVYRMHIMLRGRSIARMTGQIRAALTAAPLPGDVTCAVDVDAVSLL